MYSISKAFCESQEVTFIEVKQQNIEVTFIDYGATITKILVPDKNQKLESVLIEYKNLSSYIKSGMYLNAIIGPTSGRIKNAKFTIGNEEYCIDKNFLDTENLHGGQETFARKYFSYEIIDGNNETKVIFTYDKLESNSLYPGNQKITIIYTVKKGELLVEFIGTTDKDTLLNLTNHAYFNLSGNMKQNILGHQLRIKASNVLALDENVVPYKLESIRETLLDFTKTRQIGGALFTEIDNPFILDEVTFESPNSILYDPLSKRKLEVFTTYPSIVCYTHNYPDFEELQYNTKHTKYLGICFETQNPPNGINIKGMPDSILRKNEKYYHKTLFKFSVGEE